MFGVFDQLLLHKLKLKKEARVRIDPGADSLNILQGLMRADFILSDQIGYDASWGSRNSLCFSWFFWSNYLVAMDEHISPIFV